MKLKFNGFLVLFLVLVTQLTFAQERVVSGIVSDNTGLPLPGVSVLVKGTKTGTQTDFDGKFSIKATPTQILVFSYIGMTSQEIIASSASINAKLANSSVELEGVVVTALGIKKADKAIGYASTKVSGADVTKGNNQNLVSALSGKVAGVQVTASGGAPGQASRLVIRGGNKSLTNSNEPLYVIDGMPMSNANDGNANTVTGINSPNRASDINPNDIESITVLKGAAGAVLYGNRGSNGVVLITTKTGSNKAGKPIIEYTSAVAVDDALVLPDYQTEYAQGGNSLTYTEGGSRSFGPRITGQTVSSPAAGASRGLGAQQIQLKAFDPRKQFLKTGLTYNNNISLSNSTEAYDMFVSIGQSKQTSIVPNQGFQKFNGRFNSNYRFSSKFTAGVNLSYNASEGDLSFAGQDGNNPIFALFHAPVSWDLTGYGYERPDGRQINFRGGSFDNPLWSVYKNSAKSDSQRYITGVNFAFDVTKDFKLSYRLGNDYLSDQRTLFKDINTGGNPLGNLTYDNITRKETTSTLIATFNKDITEKFKATLTAGQDYNNRTFQQSQVIGTELILPSIINTNNIKTASPPYLYNSRRTLFGLFGDLSLSYDNYLYVSIVGRNEWSSTLPKDNRSFFYPGVSASLIFTEAFKIESDAITYGKLRLGASKTGRDADVYLTQPAYRKAIFADGFTPGVEFPFNNLAGYTIQNTISNGNLSPEFTTEYEVGVELKLFKDRIGVDATYYRNINTDGIIPLDISPAAGATATIINSGKTTSKGFELMLRTTPILTKDFRWDVTFNFSRIRSHVDETYPGVDRVYLGGFDGNPAIYAVKGERLGTLIGTGYARNENGEILVDDDGIPSILDGIILGHTEADWTGGLSTSVTYKNIYFTALADMRHGGYMYSGTEELLDFYGVSKNTLTRNDDYIFPGVNATTGSPNDVVVKRDANWYGLGAYPNEQYVYENNWIKLREVTLGYTFKLKDKYIRSLDLGLYGRNLFIWSDVPHVDPESSSFGTGNAQGVSRFAFPTTRTIGFNLKAQF
ncbi:SusC/RagA family TonB-linked outer membrane protein [Flavobacterium geliluteum]|uniref:SusC/RagA family TonB-linked outer membrane protein n=1 Tax=Flavobacterium geliluteum TaxID=2816120 RepID=A0A940X8U4_9FLAO|nr:SusC/RagA family TonB-linked outer membrane protein [Flavobacterium geliluteum]MBP4137722.1 SusC/RagA family TonB-linked outer membrane protein [Flavobacterium geliluteum]